MKRIALVALAGIAGLALVASAQENGKRDWKKLRPDFPDDLKEPTAELYKPTTPLPEGWTPPTREELAKLPWKEGWVADGLEVAKARLKSIKPEVSAAEALKLKNDSGESNRKIISAMCQLPASDDEVDWDATMNRSGGAPNTLNPILFSSRYESEMNSLHGFGIFTFDHDLKHFAASEVAKKWLRTETVDLVELRDDVTWEDGTPITAYDIEFSWHVILDKRIPVPAVRSGADELKWVKAYDAHTIVYFHKEPLVTNIGNVNWPVVAKHIYERSLTEDPSMKTSAWHAYWNRYPLSGNAYRVKEWLSGQHVVFERREDYHVHKGKPVRARPYFKTVRFRFIEDANAQLLALKNGEIDEMVLNARQWQMQTGDEDFYKQATKVRGVEWTYGCVVWNTKRPFFTDKNVRRALALAFDYDELLKKIYFDLYEPCVGPFHPASPWGTPETKPIKQDLNEAEELLDAAGWKDSDKDGVRDKDGKRFEFTILVPQGGTGDKVANVMKQNYKDIGIVVNIKMLEWATYSQLTHDRDFDAGVQAWGTGVDPDTAKNVWKAAEQRNYGSYANPKIDELFDKGKYEFDLEKRRKIYQEINRILFEDQPYLFLNYRATFWGFSKEMRGYNFSPRGLFSYAPGFSSMWKPKKKAS